jgi:hypothetical protein
MHPAQAFQLLVECAFTRLGASNFTEKMLLKSPDSQDFTIALTTSNRPKSSLQSPVTHLITLQLQLCCDPRSPLGTSKSLELVQSIVEHCWNSLSQKPMKLNLLGDVLEALDSQYAKVSPVPRLVVEISEYFLELAEEITRPTLNGLVASNLTAKEFDAVLAISRHYLSLCDSNHIPRVLYEHSADAAKRSHTTGGLLLAVTEPHAAMVHAIMIVDDGSKYSQLINYTSLILDTDSRPRNWGAVERGRRSLGGGLSPNNNGSTKCPDLEYTSLSSLVNDALRYGYSHLKSESADAQAFSSLFESLCQYLNRIPHGSCAIFLRQIQNGLSYILLDSEFHIRDYSRDRGRQNLLYSVSY